MAMVYGRIRLAAAAIAFLVLAAVAVPVAAQQPGPINPTADAVKEQQLLEQSRRIRGLGTIPDTKSYTLEQPEGRLWRQYHEGTLPWIGIIAIVGMIVLLLVFFMWRGMVRIKAGRSDINIVRFTGFERFIHWMTATCFLVMALTGLNITFGKVALLPLIGPNAFSSWSLAAKYAHNFLSFPFTLGVIAIFCMWLVGNIPNKVDVTWFKRGGGIVGDDEPPAYRFNAGQKMVYWLVVLGGTIVIVSGDLLLFPFYGTTIAGMQLAQMVHGTIALLFFAAMLGHIYIGTIGMEGAFEAMHEGTVDLNWAKQHHRLWVEEEQARVGPAESVRQQPAKPVTPTA